jgi:phage terminase large subunit GpA-like protein
MQLEPQNPEPKTQNQPFWFPGERAALTLPTDLTVSQWAEAHREFPKDASFPGRWDPHKAPYAVAPMDAFTDPRVERITLVGAARSVKTEIWLNMLGYVICQDPGPALVVMPTETKVKRICRRITKMIKASPELRKYLTGNPDDLQKKSIVLKHMEIIFATAGSAADLGEFEARYVFESEADKYPENVGGYGSPTQMAEMRTRTFWNRKIVTESTPTNPEGFISKDYDRSNRGIFWVPCPECGGYQVLDFFWVKHRGTKLMEWPKELQKAEYILDQWPAVYECRYCQAEIEERQKPGMVAQGIWGFEQEKPDGRRPVEVYAVSHMGYQWGGEISPFMTGSEMAAKFFEVKDDREQLKTFWNEWLGRPWKEIIQQRPASAILELRTNRPAREVPEGTLALTAGIDNQKHGFWISIWAWALTGNGLIDQHLIRYGFLSDFDELEIWLFQDVYHTRDGRLTYPVWRGGIDTGGTEGGPDEATQTEQVYEWLRRSGQGRIFGVKGASRPLPGGKKMVHSIIDKMPGQGRPIPGGIRLWNLDTNALKDAFWSRVESGRVHLHADTKEIFAAHLAAEAKERDKRGRMIWVQQGRMRNDLLDTTIYAGAMADPECWGGVMVLPRPQPGGMAAADPGQINPITGKPRGSFWGR